MSEQIQQQAVISYQFKRDLREAFLLLQEAAITVNSIGDVSNHDEQEAARYILSIEKQLNILREAIGI